MCAISATQGLSNAQAQFDKAASKISSMPLSVSSSQSPDTVDLSDQMVAMMSAQNDFSANIKVAQTDDQMQQSVLSLLA